MIIKLDKFFVQELQKNGYNLDREKLIKIYRDSRKMPDCIKQEMNILLNFRK